MARFITGNSFSTGDQVTADTLNNAVNNAKVSTDSVDDSTIDIDTSGGLAKLRVKTATGASDGVALSNIQHQPANTVLVRDANSTGAVSAKAVADTQILIGDGTGFTSAALSGDATMTNAGAVTVSSVASGATGTTASSGDSSTKLATTEYADSIRPNIVTSTKLDAATLSVTQGTYIDFPTLETAITSRFQNTKFIVTGFISMGFTTQNSDCIVKAQYKVGSGAYQDFNLATGAGNRVTGHFAIGQNADNNTGINSEAFSIPTPAITNSAGDVITFKLQIADVNFNNTLYINREEADDSDDNSTRRVISTLTVQEV